MKRYLFISNTIAFCLLAGMLLSGCDTQNKFASSFGKRRYAKGFYVDVPGAMQTATCKKNNKRPAKVFVEIPLHDAPAYTLNTTDVKPTKVFIHKPAIANPIAQNKIAVSKPSVFIANPPTVNNNDSHTEDNSETSHFSTISLVVFLLSAVAILLTLLVGIIVAIGNPAGAAVTLFAGFLVAAGMDLAAVILALLAVERKEPNLDGAKVVLIINGISLLIFLVAWARRGFK